MSFAVAAGVDILHMLGNGKLSRHHDQLFGDLLADDMPLMAAGTGQLFLGKAVLDHCLRLELYSKHPMYSKHPKWTQPENLDALFIDIFEISVCRSWAERRWWHRIWSSSNV
jgi:hypothetical protein